MTREEKESLLREAVDILIKLDNHLMTSRDNTEFSAWVEDLMDKQADVLRETRQEIVGFRDDAEIRYGHQLGFDKIYAYERCIDLIDGKIKELSE